MTVYSDNAAGRLHVLLTAFGRNATQQPIRNAWGAALAVPPDEVPTFLRRVAMVFELPDEIANELNKIDPEQYEVDLARRWVGQIAPALGPALFNPEESRQLNGRFDQASMQSLEYCSSVLHLHRPQRQFADEELKRIAELIAELEAEVEGGSGIDSDLRTFLLFHADAMAQALRDLALRGPAALEDAFDQAVGAAQRRKDMVVRIESDSDSSAWKKFVNVIIAVAAVLQIATSSLALPGQIRQELEGPAPASPAVVQVIIENPQQPAAAGSPEAPDGRAALPGAGSAAPSSGRPVSSQAARS